MHINANNNILILCPVTRRWYEFVVSLTVRSPFVFHFAARWCVHGVLRRVRQRLHCVVAIIVGIIRLSRARTIEESGGLKRLTLRV